MNKKNKIMMVLAIGAVLLLIGSGVVRCAVTNAVGEAERTEETIEAGALKPQTETAQTNPVTIIGGTTELYDTFGKTRNDFEMLLSDHVSAKPIKATTATWDCQAWIDFAEGTYLTNFTLNDSAMTIVTAIMDAQGKLSIL